MSTFQRGDEASFTRQWKTLWSLIKSPEGKTLKELADEFGVSVRTVRRDLETIQDTVGDFDAKNGRCGEKRYSFERMPITPNFYLTREELLAFYVGRRLMEPLQGTYFWEAIGSACDKIKLYLNQSTIEYADRIVPFFQRLEYSRSNYKKWGTMIDDILRAMEESLVVTVTYRSIAAGKNQTYDIHPYSYVYYQGFLYLVGYSCKASEVRFWKINRLRKAEVSREKFSRPKNFNVEGYMRNAFCPFISRQGAVKAKILFAPSAARYILEQDLAIVKKTTELTDGSLTVEIEAEEGKPLIRWLLGFGTNVTVLEPKSLRNQMVNEALQIVEEYGRANKKETPGSGKKTSGPSVKKKT